MDFYLINYQFKIIEILSWLRSDNVSIVSNFPLSLVSIIVLISNLKKCKVITSQNINAPNNEKILNKKKSIENSLLLIKTSIIITLNKLGIILKLGDLNSIIFNLAILYNKTRQI